MLPTSRWKLRQTLLKVYASKISHLEENIRYAQTMVSELIDLSDYEAAASLQVVIARDEQTLDDLKEKLELVRDEESFKEIAASLEGEVEEDDFLE